MARKKKARLGRGLGALLGEVQHGVAATAASTAGGLRQLPIEHLRRGKYQPRRTMAQPALEELAESIRVEGVIQPLLVREIEPGCFEIIAGERRWRGAQLAGLATVPAVVREVSDQSAMAVALIENIQREDLNALEEAGGFARLLDEFGLTHQQIADAVGRSRAAISNILRLLGLHAAVKKLLEAGKIDMGHARALLALPTSRQPEAAAQVVAAGMTVRAAEQLVKRMQAAAAGADDKRQVAAENNPDVLRFEEDLSTRLGARVSIQHGAKKGKVVIHYHSLDELDGIIARIK